MDQPTNNSYLRYIMKKNSLLLILLGVLVLAGALYRLIPGRPWGFAPQIAMALFSGSVVKNKKLSFALPLLSMFISDLIYQGAYWSGIGDTQGFYSGQWVNYLLFTGLTALGWLIQAKNVFSIILGSLAGPVLYFLASNGIVWLGGGGYNRPKTFDGLIQCLNDGLPFFRGSLYATFLFSALFFGGYAWWAHRHRTAAAH